VWIFSMTASIVDALILAVFADGKIDTEEAVLLQVFFSNYPEFSDVSRDSFEEAQIKLRNRLQSGKSVSDLVEEIGKNLNDSDRNTAFAFAYEICASNFTLDEHEIDLLQKMQKLWKLKPSVVTAIELSAELRYRN
jgi:hypothetical protein